MRVAGTDPQQVHQHPQPPTLNEPQAVPPVNSPPVLTYRVVHIQSEPPRRPFNGLNSRTVIRTHQSPDRLPAITATKRAEATRVARDRVSVAQRSEWKPELAKLLPYCRYTKPLYSTVTQGIGHTLANRADDAPKDDSFCSYPPPPLERVADPLTQKKYTFELDRRGQVLGAIVSHLAPRQASVSHAFRMRDRRDQQYDAGQHAEIIRELEERRRVFRDPALTHTGSPLEEFTHWLEAAGVVLPGTPLQSVADIEKTICPPASAIANSGDQPTRIQLNATALRFDYHRPVSLQRWIASGETPSWLTLGAIPSHEYDTRLLALELEQPSQSFPLARVDPRRRQLQRRLSSHGDRRLLADIGFAYLRGMTQTEIAAKLGIELATVRRHIAWCHSKLGWLCFYRGASQEIIRASVWREKSSEKKHLPSNDLAVLRDTSFEIRTLMMERSWSDDSSTRT